MQGAEFLGTKLRGTEIIKIDKRELDVIILDTSTEQKDQFELVHIETSRGRIDCAYYRAEGTDKGVIMVTGVGGGFDSPADSLYPRLATELKLKEISALRIKFRNPKDLAESLIDVLVGIEFLKSQGVNIFGLIGHSLGGAVVVQAAFNSKNVKTIVMLSQLRVMGLPLYLSSQKTRQCS